MGLVYYGICLSVPVPAGIYKTSNEMLYVIIWLDFLNQLRFDLINTDQDCFVNYTEVQNCIQKVF